MASRTGCRLDLGEDLLRRSRVVSLVLVVGAVILLTASIVSRWAHDVLLDTDTWMETVGPIGTDDRVTEALATAIGDEALAWIDAENRLEGLLPPALAPVADRLAEDIERIVREEIDAFFASDIYETLWTETLRGAHTAAVAIIRDQIPFVSTEGGVVTVDLRAMLTPIADRISERLQQAEGVLPDSVADRIELDDALGELVRTYESEGLPESLAEVQVYTSDRLASVQETVGLLDRLVWVLPVVTVLFAVGALVFAPDRRTMAVGLLVGAALGVLGAWAGIAWVESRVVAGIQDVGASEVAKAVFDGVTAGLDRVMLTLAAVGGSAGIAVWVWARRRPNDAV